MRSHLRRDAPSPDRAIRFSVPPPSMQPPERPLLNPSSLGTLHDLGFLFGPIIPGTPSCRTFSLLPDKVTGRFSLLDGHIFADAEDRPSTKYWHVMESSLPFVQDRDGADDSCWAGPERLRPSGASPLFDVQHELQVSIACAYTAFEGKQRKLKSNLQFSLPVRFVDVAPSITASPHTHTVDSPRSSIDLETTPLFADAAPCVRSLPAYSQLFDSSGERLIDYSMPLPMYSPPSTSKLWSFSQTADNPPKDERSSLS